jgi:hypothetical protein
MIPEEKRAAVARGLQEAFGVTEFEEIRMMKDLAQSMVFRIVVRGSPFLLKLNTRSGDPTCQLTCMRAAAEAGLTPRIRYAGSDGISITDFVEPVSFPASEALVRLPKVLRFLHALPPFPTRASHLNTTCTFLLNKGPAVDGFIRKFREAAILPAPETEELFARFAEVTEAYQRRDPDMVSSHNDLFKPDNILFDGRRVWLVDWEAAFLNDRYTDLAVVANMIVTRDADEASFLEEYFGAPPDLRQLARFFLARQLAHIFYAMVFLWQGSSAKPIDWSETVPEYSDFHRRFWAGEVKLADNRTKAVYGRVHWQRLLENTRQPRYNEALRLVSG